MPKYELVKENKTLMNATQSSTHDTRPDCWDHVSFHDTYEKAVTALKQAKDCRHQVRDDKGKVVLWSADVV
jgi:hypothetical protein